jgi:hypothetical protein
MGSPHVHKKWRADSTKKVRDKLLFSLGRKYCSHCDRGWLKRPIYHEYCAFLASLQDGCVPAWNRLFGQLKDPSLRPDLSMIGMWAFGAVPNATRQGLRTSRPTSRLAKERQSVSGGQALCFSRQFLQSKIYPWRDQDSGCALKQTECVVSKRLCSGFADFPLPPDF